jgi:hypothetical protein
VISALAGSLFAANPNAQSAKAERMRRMSSLSMNLLADASTISARNGFKPAEMPWRSSSAAARNFPALPLLPTPQRQVRINPDFLEVAPRLEPIE